MPAWELIANVALSRIENAALGHHLRAFYSSFRANSRRYLETVRFTENSNDFVYDSEIIPQDILAELGAREIPTAVHHFPEVSQIGSWRSLMYGLGTLCMPGRHKLHGLHLARRCQFLPAPGTHATHRAERIAD